jgi:hypothetical protein
VRSVSRLYNEDKLLLPVSFSQESSESSRERVCRQTVSGELQNLVAEAGDSSGTQMKGNVHC